MEKLVGPKLQDGKPPKIQASLLLCHVCVHAIVCSRTPVVYIYIIYIKLKNRIACFVLLLKIL